MVQHVNDEVTPETIKRLRVNWPNPHEVQPAYTGPFVLSEDKKKNLNEVVDVMSGRTGLLAGLYGTVDKAKHAKEKARIKETKRRKRDAAAILQRTR